MRMPSNPCPLQSPLQTTPKSQPHVSRLRDASWRHELYLSSPPACALPPRSPPAPPGLQTDGAGAAGWAAHWAGCTPTSGGGATSAHFPCPLVLRLHLVPGRGAVPVAQLPPPACPTAQAPRLASQTPRPPCSSATSSSSECSRSFWSTTCTIWGVNNVLPSCSAPSLPALPPGQRGCTTAGAQVGDGTDCSLPRCLAGRRAGPVAAPAPPAAHRPPPSLRPPLQG